jgi:hypothetical protein
MFTPNGVASPRPRRRPTALILSRTLQAHRFINSRQPMVNAQPLRRHSGPMQRHEAGMARPTHLRNTIMFHVKQLQKNH